MFFDRIFFFFFFSCPHFKRGGALAPPMDEPPLTLTGFTFTPPIKPNEAQHLGFIANISPNYNVIDSSSSRMAPNGVLSQSNAFSRFSLRPEC